MRAAIVVTTDTTDSDFIKLAIELVCTFSAYLSPAYLTVHNLTKTD